ncbi:MAG: DNA-directed RNA polymerase II subunit rpb7 [Amphiamblys sp. WSBS2006]|nr:MAG: DNA-directed RNA polymerase II subunit rpb7 [Amphiamblys sp. WSBS2006]
MFLLKELTKDLFLEPRHIAPGIEAFLHRELFASTEGSCRGLHGYIVAVLDIKEISKGKINDITGEACFTVRYTALLLRPIKNEVVDALVTDVHKMGFFCEIGPLKIFVSTHQIPDGFFFDASGAPSFQNTEHNIRIEKKEHIRLRIIGLRIDANDIFAVGSIKEDYLGVV